jgi:hypothetical protein
MKVRLLIFLVAAVGFLILPVPMFAHHGTAGSDMTKTITLRGTVTQFEFINPHALLYFDVKDDKGNIEKWSSEAAPLSLLARRGWSRNSLMPGDQITISGHPAKGGAHALWIQKIVLSNGQELIGHPEGQGEDR